MRDESQPNFLPILGDIHDLSKVALVLPTFDTHPATRRHDLVLLSDLEQARLLLDGNKVDAVANDDADETIASLDNFLLTARLDVDHTW